MIPNPPFDFPSPLPNHPLISLPMPDKRNPFDLGDEDG
jgi:hypothetical protein